MAYIYRGRKVFMGRIADRICFSVVPVTELEKPYLNNAPEIFQLGLWKISDVYRVCSSKTLETYSKFSSTSSWYKLLSRIPFQPFSG